MREILYRGISKDKEVFIFGSLGGFWGVFFAIPLATFVNVLIKLWPRT